ncbi:NYN domain-containing protein [Clostridium scatologenes]|uniref:NYN domain-containing protein n=1 Tax=Clostridium scatologenes TaxID=1548 RepID=A0A0E3GSE8_CLOSL|nr:NYN domain-containing protein [Clostridium scatologenes]AKA71946.1 hypothetical protein CSCA_4821 [Clostridium scatologenes]
MSKLGIFIDYDNVYDIIDKKYNKNESIEIHIKFFENLWEKFKEYDIVKFIAFIDFTKINKNNLITELQKRSVKLEHCYSNGAKEEYRKNASDLALCISVIKSIYELDIDTYVLISSDCDMIPILNELKFRSKKTIHIFSPTCANRDIKEYDKDKKWAVINDFYSIEEILGVEVYEDKISKIEDLHLKEIVGKSLLRIFENISMQRTKENKYGFGYLTSDIMKSNEMVKEDAQKIAKAIKEKGVIVALPELIDGKFENLRLNKNHKWVCEFLKDKIEVEENKDIFIEK